MRWIYIVAFTAFLILLPGIRGTRTQASWDAAVATALAAQDLERGEFWVYAKDGPDQTDEINAANLFCTQTLGRCNVHLGPGRFMFTQILMQQHGGTLIGSGPGVTHLNQFNEGVNKDAIRFKQLASNGDSSQHWGKIEALRIRKGSFGDPRTTDTKGSGINFCAGSQGENMVLRDVFVQNFPDHGIRYGCPNDWHGPGDPTGPIEGYNANGGFVPGMIENVALFGNGLNGLHFDKRRLITSRFLGVGISGDGNGWRQPDGHGSLVEVDVNCGGYETCGQSITLIGLKSEISVHQTTGVTLNTGNGSLVSIIGLSHKHTGGGPYTGTAAAIRITGNGSRVHATGLAGLFIDAYLIDEVDGITVPINSAGQQFYYSHGVQ